MPVLGCLFHGVARIQRCSRRIVLVRQVREFIFWAGFFLARFMLVNLEGRQTPTGPGVSGRWPGILDGGEQTLIRMREFGEFGRQQGLVDLRHHG